MLMSAFISMTINYKNSENLKGENKELKNKLDKLELNIIGKIDGGTTEVNHSVKEVNSSCNKPKNGSREIELACLELKKASIDHNSRKDNAGNNTIEVKYYAKETDRGGIKADIERLGFSVTLPKEHNNKPSNTIWYGSDVNLEDVKDVAYSLIAAGVDLKLILKFNPDVKGTIEVGYSPNCGKNDPSWKVEKLRLSETKFPEKNKKHNCPTRSSSQYVKR
jgi:hypothetical protein